MFTAVFSVSDGVVLHQLDAQGDDLGIPTLVQRENLGAAVAEREMHGTRWVWDDTSRWYRKLLSEGVRVERCVDLRLSHAILRRSELTADSRLATAESNSWDRGASEITESIEAAGRAAPHTLFDLDDLQSGPAGTGADAGAGGENTLGEFALQREAVADAQDPRRLGLLLAAESAGALVAAEMMWAGLPWRADVHNSLLESVLGTRPANGARPELLQAVLRRLREALEAPTLNPDSAPELMKALAVAGLRVTSTRSWHLKGLKHPAIAPLLQYKKMSRLLTASGWHWLDTNVRDGRFYPEYVPGGVVTGRWASTGGGGALQLPKQVRGAVTADPGWKLVVADASQLEPRILAAMSGDRAMAEAGAAGDLYAGIVASGAVATRDQAKVAMLGAMYGATTGESGRLMPTLARAFPRAIELVEEGARAGERGEIVSTRLGRSSPRPGSDWQRVQSEGRGENATEAEVSRARGEARRFGRFTRNFMVQGSAAEWALCWMANVRRELFAGSHGAPLLHCAHLVFFMHDEVVVHTPAAQADDVAAIIRAAAADAGVLMFGALPVTFPVTVAIVDNYGEAK